MAMTNATIRKINTFKKIMKGQPFTKEDLEANNCVTLQTLEKYNLVRSEDVKVEVSIDELIETINDMIGWDCYEMTGYYSKEGDKIYYNKYGYYQFV